MLRNEGEITKDDNNKKLVEFYVENEFTSLNTAKILNNVSTLKIPINKTKGKVYNIGGGIKFNLSLLESFKIIEKTVGKKLNFILSSWRPADQKVYISDVVLAKKDFGWYPKIFPEDGLKKLYIWIIENKSIFNKIYNENLHLRP